MSTFHFYTSTEMILALALGAFFGSIIQGIAFTVYLWLDKRRARLDAMPHETEALECDDETDECPKCENNVCNCDDCPDCGLHPWACDCDSDNDIPLDEALHKHGLDEQTRAQVQRVYENVRKYDEERKEWERKREEENKIRVQEQSEEWAKLSGDDIKKLVGFDYEKVQATPVARWDDD